MRCSTAGSVIRRPSIVRMSASNPGASLPVRSPRPQTAAAVDVQVRSASARTTPSGSSP